jgi:hypothetical protein
MRTCVVSESGIGILIGFLKVGNSHRTDDFLARLYEIFPGQQGSFNHISFQSKPAEMAITSIQPTAQSLKIRNKKIQKSDGFHCSVPNGKSGKNRRIPPGIVSLQVISTNMQKIILWQIYLTDF